MLRVEGGGVRDEGWGLKVVTARAAALHTLNGGCEHLNQAGALSECAAELTRN